MESEMFRTCQECAEHRDMEHATALIKEVNNNIL